MTGLSGSGLRLSPWEVLGGEFGQGSAEIKTYNPCRVLAAL